MTSNEDAKEALKAGLAKMTSVRLDDRGYVTGNWWRRKPSAHIKQNLGLLEVVAYQKTAPAIRARRGANYEVDCICVECGGEAIGEGATTTRCSSCNILHKEYINRRHKERKKEEKLKKLKELLNVK